LAVFYGTYWSCPNNVDVEYGLSLNGHPTDIAVATERQTHKLRVFSLPDMQAVDGSGLEMFMGETGASYRGLMGIALYKTRLGDIYCGSQKRAYRRHLPLAI
jgi:3-phytase